MIVSFDNQKLYSTSTEIKEWKSKELLPFCSPWHLCYCWAHRTNVSSFNKCAALTELIAWKCLLCGSAHQCALRPKANHPPMHRASKIMLKFVSLGLWSSSQVQSSSWDWFHLIYHNRSSLDIKKNCLSHLLDTSKVISQSQTIVKCNKVIFPRWFFQACSLAMVSLDSR